MADPYDKVLLQQAGEQTGRAVLAETSAFTGKVQFNFKNGRLINWNIEECGWPEKKQ